MAMQNFTLFVLFVAASFLLPATALLVGQEQALVAEARHAAAGPDGCEPDLSYIETVKKAVAQAANCDCSSNPPGCGDDDSEILATIDAMEPDDDVDCNIKCPVAALEPSPAMLHAQQMARKGDFLMMDAQKTDREAKKKAQLAERLKKQATAARKQALDDYRAANNEANNKAKAAVAACAAGDCSPADDGDNDAVDAAKRKAEEAKEASRQAQECQRRKELAQSTQSELAKLAANKKCQADAEAAAATQMAMDVAAEAQKAMHKFSQFEECNDS